MNISTTFQTLESEITQLRGVLGSRLPLKASVCVLPAVADGEEDMAIEHIMPELKQDTMLSMLPARHTLTCISGMAIRRSPLGALPAYYGTTIQMRNSLSWLPVW